MPYKRLPETFQVALIYLSLINKLLPIDAYIALAQ